MMPTHFAAPSPGGYMPVYLSGPLYAQQPQPQHQTDVRPLSSADVDLVIRQQPKEALVTVDGKEKARKPVDPPPIIQLKVKPNADPQGHYMQSPYLIMIADLWHPEEDEANPEKALSGTICSSLHRLKDVDNKDGAFFVFGDISIKQQGEHRLRFSLFDIHKPGNVYEFVTSIISSKFKVVSAKDFHGMDESTYLSRAFSDQGVRLRLRKEPRHVMGRKRSPPSQSFEPPPPQQFQPPTPTNTSALAYQMTSATYHSAYATHGDNSPVKRQRVEEDSSPRYTAGHINSSPSAQIPSRQGNLPVQSPSGVSIGMNPWQGGSIGGYGSNYSYGRGMSLGGTSGSGELSHMGPPIGGSAPMALRPPFSSAHTTGIGLPSVTARSNNLFAGLEGYSDEGMNLESSYHGRADSLSGPNSHLDYSNHPTDGIRAMPVQSPDHGGGHFPRSDFHFQPSNMQSGSIINPFENRMSSQWPGVPPSRYEERVDRARSHYQINTLHNPIGASDGHHASPHPGAGFDDQYKHDDHHFKTEGQ